MANVENVEEMVGTRQAEAAAVATESGGTVATESGEAVATESGGAATTGDETVATAGDETAATGGMRTKVHIQSTSAMLKRWWGRLEKRRMATDSGGDETATRPGTRPAVPGTRPATKTAATAGDERDGGDRWGNVYGRRGVEFDETEMAALEGQRLVVEFRCGIY